MNIREAQELLAQFFQQRGWSYSVQETLVHLMEEVGELTWHVRRPDSSAIEKLEDEVADVLSLALHMANALKVDAEGAWLRKLEKDDLRFPRKGKPSS